MAWSARLLNDRLFCSVWGLQRRHDELSQVPLKHSILTCHRIRVVDNEPFSSGCSDLNPTEFLDLEYGD